jgi:hypothetical protein
MPRVDTAASIAGRQKKPAWSYTQKYPTTPACLSSVLALILHGFNQNPVFDVHIIGKADVSQIGDNYGKDQ